MRRSTKRALWVPITLLVTSATIAACSSSGSSSSGGTGSSTSNSSSSSSAGGGSASGLKTGLSAYVVPKLLGAQYLITGAFMSDGRGNFVLTGRTINEETSVIGNPTRINTKGEDVLGMIAQLSAKMSAEMKIPALRVGDAGAAGSAQPAGQPAAAASPAAVQVASATSAQTASPAPTQPATAAPTQPATAAPAPKAESRPSKSARKMDMKTAMLYSKALEEEDAGNKTKAVELYRQVVDKFPEYPPAQQKIAKLSRS